MQNIERKLKVAITHGDCNGVGYEMILRTFSEPEIMEMFTPIVYGSVSALRYYIDKLQVNCKFNVITDAADAADAQFNIIDSVSPDVNVEMGNQNSESLIASRQALDRALQDYSLGLFDVIVMAPSVEEEINAVVDSLGNMQNTDAAQKLMPMPILVDNGLKLTSVAGNISKEELNKYISKEDIVERATSLRNALRRDLRIDNPCIAVLSTCEDVEPESENSEDACISDAVMELGDAGVQAFGPYSINSFFDNCLWLEFNAVLAMYDGQYLQCYKRLFDENGCMLYSALPVIVTMPLQGSSNEKDECECVNEMSFRNAIYTAIDAYRNRSCYDQPLTNPLPKLYHERKEDGDRSRFTVRKKDDAFTKNDTQKAE